MDIQQLIQESHATAVEKGWWQTDRPFLEQLMLWVTEISEAAEEWRVHGMDKSKMIYYDADSPEKPLGIAIEIADLLIRASDTCGKYDIPLVEALKLKLAYNKTRPHRHGGKLA